MGTQGYADRRRAPNGLQGQLARQIPERGEAVAGSEDVDERQRRRHPARQRLVGRVAEERVEPDDAAGAAFDAEELPGQELGLARVPAVGQDDHDRAPVHESRPFPVDLGERLADFRPARPVAHLGEPTEDLPVGAPAQMVGDTCEARREGERLDPAEDVLEREEKLEQEAAVQVHRAGYVAEQDEPDLLALPLAVAQLDQVPAREVGPERPPEVDAPAPPHGPSTAREAMREPPRDLDRKPEDLVELVGAEGRKVLADERLAVARRRHAERLARVPCLLPLAPRLQREALALLARRLEERVTLPAVGGWGLGQSRNPLRGRLGPPEGVEATVEGRDLLGATHEDRLEGEVELAAVADVEVIERTHGVRRVDQGDREAVLAEQRREPRDGRRQLVRAHVRSGRG